MTRTTYGCVKVDFPSDLPMNFGQGTTKIARMGRNSSRNKGGHGINETVNARLEDIQEKEKQEVQPEEQDVEELEDRKISEGLIRNIAENGDVPNGGEIANNVFGREYAGGWVGGG